jgi:predicted acetyltransferase
MDFIKATRFRRRVIERNSLKRILEMESKGFFSVSRRKRRKSCRLFSSVHKLFPVQSENVEKVFLDIFRSKSL